MAGKTCGIARTEYHGTWVWMCTQRCAIGYMLGRICTQKRENGYTLAWMCTQERYFGYT